MHFVSKFLVFLFVCSLLQYRVSYGQTINRKELVQRHNIHVKRSDSLSSLTVGNGAFAFTVDVTGLQSFPEYYKTGVPLGTQSEWGWHSFPNTGNYKLSEAYKEYDLNGRKISYCVQVKSPQHNKEAVEYFRVNDHRLQLGNVGLDIIKKDGKLADINDIKNIDQQIDLWTGIITSNFTVENVPIKVITCAAQETDAIACSIESSLLKEGRIKIRIRFPYPNGQFKDEGTFYGNESKHATTIEQSTKKSVRIKHKLDTTEYYTSCTWNTNAEVKETAPHYFNITPQKGSTSFEFSAGFSSIKTKPFKLSFNETRNSSISGWAKYWNSGAAVDFAGSTDPRAFELERRVILSQYLTKVQCAGNYPPQETGLTYNSWFGKPHIEMYWWHAAHFALWGRTELLEKSMNWYFTYDQ
jgi:protein-glucosylgalactosylhydroxylysine glucosidase